MFKVYIQLILKFRQVRKENTCWLEHFTLINPSIKHFP